VWDCAIQRSDLSESRWVAEKLIYESIEFFLVAKPLMLDDSIVSVTNFISPHVSYLFPLQLYSTINKKACKLILHALSITINYIV
jgi:hypothetical protein